MRKYCQEDIDKFDELFLKMHLTFPKRCACQAHRQWLYPRYNLLWLQALDRWEDRLENIWEGRPYDILDAALADTVSRFPVHIQPFRDMIGGMRIDLVKSRYETFDELYEYMYR